MLELDRTALILSRRSGRGPGGLPGRADPGLLPPPRVGRDPRRPSAEPAGPRRWHRCGWSPGWCFPSFAGIWLALEVSWGHEGGAAKKQEKDYWRKNMATYRDAKVPDLKHVELDLDLFPERSRYHVAGKYDLINPSDQPLERDPADGRPALGEAGLDHGRQALLSQEQRGAFYLHAAEGRPRSRRDSADRV